MRLGMWYVVDMFPVQTAFIFCHKNINVPMPSALSLDGAKENISFHV